MMPSFLTFPMRVAVYLALVLSAWTNGYTLGKARGEELVCEKECEGWPSPKTQRGIVPATFRSVGP